MQKKDELGVLIESGPQDWQIIQRGADDTATITLTGHWLTPQPHKRATVAVRLVREGDGEPVLRALDWVRATTKRTGTWKVKLEAVPAGGLYRLETALQLDDGPVEWGQRGDMVHHIGVGDVWLITGQSNAEGHGKSPVPDGPELGVHMFHARGQWALATHPLGDSTATRYLPNRLGSNPSHSPWLVFGKTLHAELGVPVGLIPASLGGSPLSAWTRGVDGVLFDNMLRYVEDAGGAVRGVVWYQGESDAAAEALKVYGRNFRHFVADLRKSLGAQLPVISTQLNRWVGEPNEQSDAGWENMRQLQRHLAKSLRNVFLLSTLDLGLSDGIHTNSLGNVAIGQRAASAALGGVYGRDVKFRHPNCVSVRRKTARRIELHFEHVDERLHFENMRPEQFPFAVRDTQGDVPVAGWSIPKPDRFEIRLGRALMGHAVVVGAPTTYPPLIVPQDISGHRPMLAFTQKVES
jgi:sialate O-acetylesterase